MKLQYLIDQLLSDEIKSEPYVERYGGVTQIMNKQTQGKDGKIITQKYPIACDVTEKDCNDSAALYHHLVPDDSKASVVYWEVLQPMKDIGPTKTKNFRDRKFQGVARLVVWLNLAKLGALCKDGFLSVSPLEKILTKQGKMLSGVYEGSTVKTTPRNMVKKDINTIFGKYDYDKKVNFYLYPFDYFAIDVLFTLDQCLTKGGTFPIAAPIDCVNQVGPSQCDAFLAQMTPDLRANCFIPDLVYTIGDDTDFNSHTPTQKADLTTRLCVAPPAAYVNNFSFHFDGNNQDVVTPYNAAFDFDSNSPWTFRCQFIRESTHVYLIGKYDLGFRGYLMRVQNTFLWMYFTNTNNTNQIEVRSAAACPSGLCDAIITYDASMNASGIQMYLFGLPIAMAAPIRDNLTATTKSTESVYHGSARGAAFEPCSLNIPRAWNFKMSAAEALAEYNNGNVIAATFPLNLVIGNPMGDDGTPEGAPLGIDTITLKDESGVTTGSKYNNADATSKIAAI